MTKSLDDLPRLLHQVLCQAEASYPDQAHRVWDVWERAVGPGVAERSRPLSLRSGRLSVAVANAAWMQQLSFLRESIRDAVNNALGEQLVKEVRLRIAEAEAPKPPTHRASGPPPWLSQPLSPEVVRAVAEEVEAIRDPEIREAVRQIRVRAEQVRRFREGPATAPPLGSSARRQRGGRGEP
ncbi:MAG: DUF721 domain-containing protein [Proteobacteria bacterium]|nr:DUF721 domain-containing protein [Pseudomonadota bacterium]